MGGRGSGREVFYMLAILKQLRKITFLNLKIPKENGNYVAFSMMCLSQEEKNF